MVLICTTFQHSDSNLLRFQVIWSRFFKHSNIMPQDYKIYKGYKSWSFKLIKIKGDSILMCTSFQYPASYLFRLQVTQSKFVLTSN